MAGTVHVGIVTHNSRADLPRCLASVQAQTYPDLRVCVVDNASDDGTWEWLLGYVANPLTLVRNRLNRGFGAAHNHIIRLCGLEPGDYYLALNPDVRLIPSYIERVVTRLQADERAGWATGLLRQMDAAGNVGDMVYSAGHALFRGGYAVNVGYGLPIEPVFATTREVFGAPGAAVMFKQELVADLTKGGIFYDETMFMFGEDTDVDWRARRRGWRCYYVADAIAGHRGSLPSADSQLLSVSNRYVSVIKNAFLSDLLLYNIWVIVLHVVFRLVSTPHFGVKLVARLVRSGPLALRQRQPSKIARREMAAWFVWARKQPTSQPRTLGQRLRHFWKQRCQ